MERFEKGTIIQLADMSAFYAVQVRRYVALDTKNYGMKALVEGLNSSSYSAWTEFTNPENYIVVGYSNWIRHLIYVFSQSLNRLRMPW